MSHCLNPACSAPTRNASDAVDCQTCGSALLLHGRYRPLRLLGQGGFGRTVLAVDESQAIKPSCVIKQFLPQQQTEKPRASQLFRQEAQRLKNLQSHPQIPGFLDYFEVEDQQYLVQEFIDGADLEEALVGGNPSSEQDVVQLLESLLPVLNFMHGQQVIHRDIKPANIIRRDRDQCLFLVDLGAAKLATGTALARTGTTIGSAEYTAPEQLRGKAVFASDLYSLGMTCLHLLTGVSPFNLYDVDEGRLAWQDYLRSPLEQRLSHILSKMTEVAIRQRYASAEQVLRDLEALTSFSPLFPCSSDFNDTETQQSAKLSSVEDDEQRDAFVASKLAQFAEPEHRPLSVELEQRWGDSSSTGQLSKRSESSRIAQSSGKSIRGSTSEVLLEQGLANWLRREASPDFGQDVGFALSRTVLTFLLLLVGLPGLLAWVVSAVRSPHPQTRSANQSESTSIPVNSQQPKPVTSLTNPKNAYDIFLQDAGLLEKIYKLDGAGYSFPPRPVSASEPEQKPIGRPIKISREMPIASIQTVGENPVMFDMSERGNVLLVQTAPVSQSEKNLDTLVEIFNLESYQKINALPLQSHYPPIVLLSGDGKEVLSQVFPENISFDNLPQISAWKFRTDQSTDFASDVDNLVLGSSSTVLNSGESTVIGNNPEGEISVLSQETGRELFRASFPKNSGVGAATHDSLVAIGTSPISGADEIVVSVFDIAPQPAHTTAKLRPSLFSYRDSELPGAWSSVRSVSLKFDGSGQLYIGREAINCSLSCLEIYEWKNKRPVYKHVPAQIPPFHELFFTQNPDEIVLYMPAHLGAEPQLQVWNLETGTLIKQILLGDSYSESGSAQPYDVPPLKLSSDGTKLYTAHPGEVKIWDFQALLRQE